MHLYDVRGRMNLTTRGVLVFLPDIKYTKDPEDTIPKYAITPDREQGHYTSRAW